MPGRLLMAGDSKHPAFVMRAITVRTRQRPKPLLVEDLRDEAELAQRNVRINCLSPAPTDTPMMPAFYDQVSKEFMDEHFQAPVGRNATPDEMAQPLILLNSSAASFVSGHNLFVDFGYVAQVTMGQRPGLLL